MKSKTGIFFKFRNPDTLGKYEVLNSNKQKLNVEIAKSAILTLIMRIKPGNNLFHIQQPKNLSKI